MSLKNSSPSSVESDGNTSFLRAARAGHLDKVLEHLKSNIDINTSNANGLNALHLASKDGHVDVVEELLKRGATVDAATKKGNTALHIASLAGQEDVVKLLVNHGASVNVKSQNGFTPLYMAAQENHDNVVKYLLSNGANQSLATEDGFTPLAVAMQQGHDKVVTVLLENDTRGKVRLPALHIAAKKDDVKAAKLLLENDHNPDVTSKSGFTPLHIASHYGNESIANLLIQKKADVNYSAKHNITPLHVAAKWGKTNMVSLLLERGANIESKTRDGLTPLHCAARSGHEQVVDMLLEREAPISCKTKNGLAPLHMAAQGDHVDAARILLYHRAPVDEVTVDYLTALHVAAHCGHVRVAKLLLDRQADPNARALNGFTPLHIACKKNRIKVVELLLKHGASISATTESGLTPLHVASFMGCMNIVIYLLQHDANPDVPTVRGETPLHLAARANQTDIIRILLRNGAQVDARAREQQTPLHIASRLGNVDIVMLLLQHGAKVDTTTKDMYTALHIASKEGHDEVAGVLIENGASLNATTKKGFTPLHLAAKYGNIKVAKLLLQKEAPVDAQGKNGVTPLHVASHYDHQNVALLLLDKGASPHATAKNGHTPLHIAAKKNQMDIANTLLEYGAKPNAESKAGFTPLHLSAQEGHAEMSSLLIEHEADTNQQAKNGLTPLHLCAQEDRVPVAEILVKNNAVVDKPTKAGYTPLHVASHYGQTNMVKFLLSQDADVKATTSIGYTPLHQAAQQGHTNVVNILLEKSADPNAITHNGQTPLNIAQKLGYITVIETLKTVTEPTSATATEEKYKVVAPEAMHETFMSDSEEEGGEDTMLGDNVYRYLTADEMKSLGDDSLPIDVTRDERIDSNKMVTSADSTVLPPQAIEDSISPQHYQNNYAEFIKKYTPDNVDIARHPINIGFLVSFLVDARGGAMRGCRHSGVRVIVPPRSAGSPTRITCRYVRPQRTPHPPPLMEGEALASRVLELGPVGAKFLGPVIIEVPHFAALRGKEREIVILRSDNGETWREHTVESSEDILNEVLTESFEAEDISQLEDTASGRITRILTSDFPQYFAVVSRIRQEVHAIGPEGGMVSSTVVPQVQAVFPQGALTKKIKVGLQAQPIDPELTAKLLGHGVAVSPVVTVEPRRRKFHKAITLSMPAPRAHSQGMINQYSGSTPTLRLLCSITGGTTRAQWEDVTGSTPLTFVNDCVSFTTTVSARFWLMDCRNISDATKMATELYREAIHVPFMAKFVVFAKRVDPLEARLRVFCMTDDKEDKTLEHQEHFTEVAKSRDVEVLEGKSQYIEFAGNLVPITKSGEQLQFAFRAFRENRLPFSVKVKDQHAEAIGRSLFMREPKVAKGEPPQQPICILNIVLPDDIVADTISLSDSEHIKRHEFLKENYEYYRPDPRLADMSNLLGEDWVPLATQLGLTSSEINVIKSEYPDSVAKQAQSMLRMWISQSSNRSQGNVLENALKRIGREDIIPQCLNEEHEIIKKEETVKYRIKKDISLEDRDIMKDSESIESLVQIERKEDKTKKRGSYDKYSAEEKVVEEPSDEEDFNKTVAEKRELIQKRLSVERTIPASQQRTEIVQEITSIKRQSIVEDKIAEVEQKRSPLPETKPITEEVKTTISPVEDKVSTTVKTVSDENIPDVKTVISDSKTEIKTITIDTQPEIVTKTVTIDSKQDDKSLIKTIVTETRTTQETTTDITHKPETELLEGVTQRLETKRIPKISAEEDPKSPKLSKTPPPSPADFILREQAAAVQDWEASAKELQDESASQAQRLDAEKEGKPTSTAKTITEDNLDFKVNAAPIDLEIKKKTNAFIDSERQTEPYEITKASISTPEFKEDQKYDDKKQKKGFFGTLKTIVSKSFDHSDTESEKSQKKSKKEKKKKSKDKKEKETSEILVETPTKKPRLPTPPLERPEFENIPYVEASPTSEEIPQIAIKERANELIREIENAAISKINKVSDEQNASKPLLPLKEKSFEVDVHQTIDQIGKEILDEKIDVKHTPRISKADIYEDIDSPILSEPPDHLLHYSLLDEDSQKLKITTYNLIQNEINFQGWADDKHNIVKPVIKPGSQKTKRKHGKLFGFLSKKSSKEVEESDDDISKEIVEKHDEEPSKEKIQTEEENKKSGFFNIFGKKNKKEDVDKVETSELKVDIESNKKQIELSEKTITDMQNTHNFIHEEITRFEDVRPVTTKVTKEDTKVEDKTDKTEKRKSGIFSGMFTKKDKRDEEYESSPQKSSDDKVTPKEVSSPIPKTDKAKQDEISLKDEMPLQDEITKQIVSTSAFISNELKVYEDVKPIKPTKIDPAIDSATKEEITITESTIVSKDVLEKDKPGIFGGLFVKKEKKDFTDETEKNVKEQKDKIKPTEKGDKTKSPTPDKKKISSIKSDEKEGFKAPEKTETILKQIDATTTFLKKEVENYKDNIHIKSEALLPVIDQSKIDEEKVEKRKSGIFSGIFAKKDKKNDGDENLEAIAIEDSQTKQSPKLDKTSQIESLEIKAKEILSDEIPKDDEKIDKSKPRIFSGIFGKKDKKDNEEMPDKEETKKHQVKLESKKTDVVIDTEMEITKPDIPEKQLIETNEFLNTEIEHYEDGKPVKQESKIVTDKEIIVHEKIDKSKIGILTGIFSSKDKKDTEKKIGTNKDILGKEEPDKELKIDTTDIIKQIVDTNEFLRKEVELHEDVRLVKPPIVTVEEYKDEDKSEKRKSGIFSGIFTKKDKKTGEEEFEQVVSKEMQAKPRTPIFSKMEKPSKKAEVSDINKQMTDTLHFLKTEIDLYQDVEPQKYEEISDLEETTKEEMVQEDSAILSPKKGIFKIFTKKDKKEESPVVTRKEIVQEPVEVVEYSIVEMKTRKKQKSKSKSKSSKDSSESGEESDSSTKKSRFNIFSKKPKPEIKDPIKEAASIESKIGLSEEIVKVMNDTANFLFTETKNYEDAQLSHIEYPKKQLDSESLNIKGNIKTKKSKKQQKRDSSESGEESDSASKSYNKFKLFTKKKEIPKNAITEASSKEEKLIISDETIETMNFTQDFINTEIEKYEDVKTFAKYAEKDIIEIKDIKPAEKKKEKKSKLKRDSSESGDESDSSAKRSRFSLFGRKGSKLERNEKPIQEAPSRESQLGISEIVSKEIHNTNDFLMKEVEHYHDVKQIIQYKDKQSENVPDIDLQKNIQLIDSTNETCEVRDESPEKVKKEVKFVEETALKDILDTQSFLETEKNKYQDSHYKIDPILVRTVVFESPEDVLKQTQTASPLEETIVYVDNQPKSKEVETKAKSEKKKKKGILGKIFSKSKDECDIDISEKITDYVEPKTKIVEEQAVKIEKDIKDEFVDVKKTVDSILISGDIIDGKNKSKGILGKITTKKGKSDVTSSEEVDVQPTKSKGGIFSKIGSKIATKVDTTVDAVKDVADATKKTSEDMIEESKKKQSDVSTNIKTIAHDIDEIATEQSKSVEDSLTTKTGEIKKSVKDASKIVVSTVKQTNILVAETIKDTKDNVEDKFDGLPTELKGTKDVSLTKIEDTFKTIQKVASTETKEHIKDLTKDFIKTERNNSEEIKQLIEDKLIETKHISEDIWKETKETVTTKVDTIKDEFEKRTKDIVKPVETKIQDTKDTIDRTVFSETSDLVSDQINGFLRNITEDSKTVMVEANDLKDTTIQKSSIEDIKHPKEEVTDKLVALEGTKEQIMDTKDAITEDVNKRSKCAISDHITEIEDKLKSAVSTVEDNLADIKDAAKVEDGKDSFDSNVKEIGDTFDEILDEIKDKVMVGKDSAQKGINDFEKVSKDAAKSIKSHSEEVKKESIEKLSDSKETLVKKTDSLKEKSKESRQSIGKGIMGFVKSTKDSLVHTKDSLKVKVDKKAKDDKAKIDKKSDTIKSKAKIAKKGAEDKLAEAKSISNDKVEEVKSKLKDTKHAVEGKNDELKDKANDTKYNIKDGFIEVSETTQDMLLDSKDKIKIKMHGQKEEIDKNVKDTKQDIDDIIKISKDTLIKTLDDKSSKIKESKTIIDKGIKDTVESTSKSGDMKDAMEEKLIDDTKQAAISTKDTLIENLTVTVGETTDAIDQKVKNINDKIKVDFEEAVNIVVDAKDYVVGKGTGLKDEAKVKRDSIDDKIIATSVSLKESATKAKEKFDEKMLSTQDLLTEKIVSFEDKTEDIKKSIEKDIKVASDESKQVIMDSKEFINAKTTLAKDTLEKTTKDVKTKVLDNKSMFEEKTIAAEDEAIHKLEDIQEEIIKKSKDTKKVIDKTAKDVLEKSKGTNGKMEKGVKSKAKSTGGIFSGFKQSLFGKAEESKDKVKEALTSQMKSTTESASDLAAGARDSVISTATDLKEKAKYTKDSITDEISAISTSAKKSAADTKLALDEKVVDTKDSIKVKISSLKDKTEETKEIIEKDINIIGEKSKDVVKDTKQAIESKISDTKEFIDDKSTYAKDNLEKTIMDAKDKVLHTKATIEETKDKALDKVADGVDKTKDIVDSKIKDILEDVRETKGEIEKDVKTTAKSTGGILSGLKQSIFGKAEDSKEKVKEELTSQLKSTKESAKESILGTGTDFKEKAKDTKDLVTKEISDISTSSKTTGTKIEEQLDEQLVNSKDALIEEISSLKDTTEETKDNIKNDINILTEKSKDVAKDTKKTLESNISAAKELIDDKSTHVKDKLDEKTIYVKEKIADTKAGFEDSKDFLISKLECGKVVTINKTEETKDIVDTTAKDISENIKETKGEIEKGVKSTAKSTGGILSGIKQSIFGKAEDSKDKAKEVLTTQLKSTKESASDILEQTKDSISSTAIELKEKSEDRKDSIAKKIGTISTAAKETVTKTKEDVDAKIVDTKDAIAVKRDSLKHKTEETKDIIEQDAKVVVEKSKEGLEDTKHTLESKISDTKKKIDDKYAHAKEKIDKTITEAKDKIADTKAGFKDVKDLAITKLEDGKDELIRKSEETKESVDITTKDILENIKETKFKIEKDVQSTVKATDGMLSGLKQSIFGKVEESKDKAEEILSAHLKSTKESAKDILENTKDSIASTARELKEKAEDTNDSMAKKITTISSTTEVTATKTKEDIDEKIVDTKDTIAEKMDFLKHKTEDTKDIIEKDLKVVIDKSKESLEDTKHSLESKISDNKEFIDDKSTHAKDKLDKMTMDVKNKVMHTKAVTEDTKNLALNKVSDGKDLLIKKSEDIRDSVDTTTKNILENLKEKTDKIDKDIKDTAKSTGGMLSGLKQSIFGKAEGSKDKAKKSLAGQLKSTKESARDIIGDTKDSITSTTAELKEKAGDTKDSIAKEISDISASAQESATKTKEELDGKIVHTKDVIVEEMGSLRDKTKESKGFIQKDIKVLCEKAKENLEDTKDALETNIYAAKELIDDKSKYVKDKLDKTTMDVKDKIADTRSGFEEAKDLAVTKIEHGKGVFIKKSEETKDIVDTTTKDILENVKETKGEIEKVVKSTEKSTGGILSGLKQSIFGKVEDSADKTKEALSNQLKFTKESAKDVVADTKDSFASTATELKEIAKDSKDFVVQEITAVSSSAKESATEAKEKLDGKIGDSKDAIAEKIGSLKDKTKETKDIITKDMKVVCEKSKGLEDTKHTLESKISHATEFINDKLDNTTMAVKDKIMHTKTVVENTKDLALDKLTDGKHVLIKKSEESKDITDTKAGFEEEAQEILTSQLMSTEAAGGTPADTKDSIVTTATDLKEKAEGTKDSVTNQMSTLFVSAKMSAIKIKENVDEKIVDTEDAIVEKIDSLKETTDQTKDVVDKDINVLSDKSKECLKDTKHTLETKVSDAKDTIDKKTMDIKDKILDTKTVFEDSFVDTKDLALNKLADDKEVVTEKSQYVKYIVDQTAKDVLENIKEKKGETEKGFKSLKEGIFEKAEDCKDKVKECLMSQMKLTEDDTINVVADIKDSAVCKSEELKEKAKEIKDIMNDQIITMSDSAKESVTKTKEKVEEKFLDTKEAVAEKICLLKEKTEETSIETQDTILSKLAESKEVLIKKSEDTKDFVDKTAKVISVKAKETGEPLEKGVRTTAKATGGIFSGFKESIFGKTDSKDKAKETKKPDKKLKDTKEKSKTTTEITGKEIKDSIKTMQQMKVDFVDNLGEAISKQDDKVSKEETSVRNNIQDKATTVKKMVLETKKDVTKAPKDTPLVVADHNVMDNIVDSKTVEKKIDIEKVIDLEDTKSADSIKKTDELLKDSKEEMGSLLEHSKTAKDDATVVFDKFTTDIKDSAKKSKEFIEEETKHINESIENITADDTKGKVLKSASIRDIAKYTEESPITDLSIPDSEISFKENLESSEDGKKSKGFLGKLSSKLGSKSKSEDKPEQSKKDQSKKKSKGIFSKVGDTFSHKRDALVDKPRESIVEKCAEIEAEIKDVFETTQATTQKSKEDILDDIMKTKDIISDSAETIKSDIKIIHDITKDKLVTLESEGKQFGHDVGEKIIAKKDEVVLKTKEAVDSLKDKSLEIGQKDSLVGDVSKMQNIDQNEINIKTEIKAVKAIDGDDSIGKQISEALEKTTEISDNLGKTVSNIKEVIVKTESKIGEDVDAKLDKKETDVMDGSSSSKISESIDVRVCKDSKDIQEDKDKICLIKDTIAVTKSEVVFHESSDILSDNKVSVDGDIKRKPLFRIESEEDSSEYLNTKRDSIKSNILENFSKQKLEALVTDLDIFEDSGLVEPDLSLTEKLETKLNDIEKIIEKIEKTESELHEEKIEGKLRRVERKFERMASEVIDTEKEEAKASQLTTPEMEEKQDNEFRKVVSQLSREEVSEFQKEYASLWDEQTFSHTDEWDSAKTPESQADINELPQGDIVYMGPVTLNKDNLVNKAGIEVDVIPRMRSPYASPKPKRKKRSKRAKSELGFHSKPKSTEEDRGSLPDLYTNKKGAIMNAILTMSPQRFLSHSIEGHSTISLNYFPKEERMSQSLGSSESLSKGNIMDAVVQWLNRSSSIDYMNQSYTDMNVSICDDDESLESCFLSDRTSFRPDNIVPDIFISEDEAFLIYNETTINKPTPDQPLGEASVSWEQVTTDTTKTTKAEKDEASATTPEHSTQVFDQHQLSEEMKELLKDMEKESKK